MKFHTVVSASLLGLVGLVSATSPCKPHSVCNADNCARAVTGTRLGSASMAAASADCSSFLSYTVVPAASTLTSTITPAPVTTTSTLTVTSTLSLAIGTQRKRAVVSQFTDGQPQATVTLPPLSIPAAVTVTGVPNNGSTIVTPGSVSTVMPTAVPPYASACSGVVRYSSACACFGVKPTTVTGSATTVVTTSTAPASTATVTSTITFTFTAIFQAP